jgi:translation elongation factor aEF-1 beta
MGMVALTYKVMPDSDVDDVSADDVAEQILALKDDVYDVQMCETKPLAFGLKFIQVHVVMNDGSGLSDIFEENMRAIHGTGEIEVLSMGLL